ncbi:hypothetical protein SBRV1_gp32 [Sulfolobales Beppu rod-shaped virus 1]|uniref:Uncharacterized protein n=1 Tax=Sulfolobales Beppu rod-shaped virus 1 TaxID=2493121 RepID=A0A3Q8Q432_9VIRU|nr:hypothetical protein QIT32_gp32 [Sulfolobales Beppu rod-shaped virus 1]AZI75921.1 hypothetical protein SBRV1_gp32 [Sulfolobales Beppu rod-shaped virus 1]
MVSRRGQRSIAQMKYHLYNKVFSRKTFPAFSSMFSAGTSAVLPTALQNITIPSGININYGIAYAQLIYSILNALNNFAISQLQQSSFFQSQYLFGTPQPIQSSVDVLQGFLNAYDAYVENCSILYQPAVFDETYFDLSVYQSALGTITNNQGCQQLEQILNQYTQQLQYVDVEDLGITITYNPNVDNYLFNLLQNTGVNDVLSALGQQYNLSAQDFFNTLPDLAKYVLAFLQLINDIINSGFSLDTGWLDRCVLAPNQSSTSTPFIQLQNNVKLQYFAQALGMILDLAPLDFIILMPDYNSPDRDIAILSADRAIIQIFGTILLQHFQDPSLGSLNISQSQYAETYISAYQLFENVHKIVNRKYSNIWYAKMVASAILEIARYPYQQNYTYNAGERSLTYQDFLSYWKQKWSFYGISEADLQFAQQLGEQLQGLAKVQNNLKQSQKSTFLKTYKPIFYYKNFQNIANR